jgi:hypothetical protein
MKKLKVSCVDCYTMGMGSVGGLGVVRVSSCYLLLYISTIISILNYIVKGLNISHGVLT